MAEQRPFQAKPESPYFPAPDNRPLWLQHRIKNRHHYVNVMIFNCRDLDKYDDGLAYLAGLTEALFHSPVVSQATLYDDNFGSEESAREMHARLKAYQARLERARERGKLDWMIYLRFSAVDYESVRRELQAHVEATFNDRPLPEYIDKVNSIFHIENHVMVRHEAYDALSIAGGMGVEGEPGTNKFASFGFSKPSRGSDDPKTQVAYIDWYQEVRQHDSMRGNFPDEVGRMWLQISAEQPFPFWCLTTYEFCARDMSIVKNAIGAAYYAMNAYRGDAADLYHPYYEGTGMVIAEYMKPY
jgi:hypothetical protein